MPAINETPSGSDEFSNANYIIDRYLYLFSSIHMGGDFAKTIRRRFLLSKLLIRAQFTLNTVSDSEPQVKECYPLPNANHLDNHQMIRSIRTALYIAKELIILQRCSML